MPRRPRVLVEGGIYHVYNRFARGADLFSEPDEAVEFLEILRRVTDRDGLTILAWCLMSNHYHLALRTGAVPLARTMGYVQSRIGQGYNLRHRSSGPRWQSRYKARMVEDGQHLDHLIADVHLNPVAAGLVDAPAEHTFSGHRELLGKVKQPLVGQRPEAVTRWACRGAEKRMESDEFRAAYEKLDRDLSSGGRGSK